MQAIQLKIDSRTVGTKAQLKVLRSTGKVPAQIYGPGSKNEACAIDEKELRAAFKGNLEANFIIDAQSDSAQLKGKKLVLKNISRDPLWKIEHVDFYEVAMNRPLTTNVPLRYTGTADGVKNEGGLLQIIRRSLQIRALPGDLPDFIDVDVSALKLNETLHISELKISEKLKVLDDKKFALVAVAEPEKEEVAATPVAAAAGEGTAAATSTAAAGAAAPGAAAAGAAPAGKDAAKKDDKKDAKK